MGRRAGRAPWGSSSGNLTTAGLFDTTGAMSNAHVDRAFPENDAEPFKTARALALQFVATLPPGRELALTLTKLEEAVLWAAEALRRGV
jgi:hypothetical protein